MNITIKTVILTLGLCLAPMRSYCILPSLKTMNKKNQQWFRANRLLEESELRNEWYERATGQEIQELISLMQRRLVTDAGVQFSNALQGRPTETVEQYQQRRLRNEQQ